MRSFGWLFLVLGVMTAVTVSRYDSIPQEIVYALIGVGAAVLGVYLIHRAAVERRADAAYTRRIWEEAEARAERRVKGVSGKRRLRPES